MEIDFTCPTQVFDRIAQLDHETRERLTKIDNLQNEQREADAEYGRLERLAIAYTRPISEPVAISAKANRQSGYSWDDIPYAITIELCGVDAIPLTSVIELDELTAEQVEAALSGIELTPTEKAACFGAAMEELMDEDDPPDVARNFQPTGGH